MSTWGRERKGFVSWVFKWEGGMRVDGYMFFIKGAVKEGRSSNTTDSSQLVECKHHTVQYQHHCTDALINESYQEVPNKEISNYPVLC